MSNELTPAQELADIKQQIEMMRAGNIEAWQLASHMIGRQQVDYLAERGLTIVFRKEYEEMMKKRVGATGK